MGVSNASSDFGGMNGVAERTQRQASQSRRRLAARQPSLLRAKLVKNPATVISPAKS